MNDFIDRVLVSEEQIEEISTRLAAQIDADYGDGKHRLVLVSILKGSLMFTGKLMEKINTVAELEVMKVSSYGSGTVSTGAISVLLDIKRNDLCDLDLLIIEDIIDTGRTLDLLTRLLRERGAHSVKTCTMLDKPSRRTVDFKADYVGVEVPDEFVVGYGLDYDEKYRNLPYVGILKKEVYAGK